MYEKCMLQCGMVIASMNRQWMVFSQQNSPILTDHSSLTVAFMRAIDLPAEVTDAGGYRTSVVHGEANGRQESRHRPCVSGVLKALNVFYP